MSLEYGVHAYPDGTVARAVWAFRLTDTGPDPMPTVQFDQDDPIPLVVDGTPWSGLYPHGQIIGGDHWLVLQGSRPDRREGVTLLVKRRARTVEASEECGGVWPLWLSEDGIILRANPARAGSQGFAWVNPGNVAVYADDVRSAMSAPANPAKGRPEPVILGCPFTLAGWDWIVAQDFSPGVDRVIAYRQSDDELFTVAYTVSQVRPRGAQLADGSFVAAISTPGFTVHSSQFTRWAKPVPPPIVVTPPEPEPEELPADNGVPDSGIPNAPEPTPEVAPEVTPEDPAPTPAPTKRPWWARLIEAILETWWEGRK